MKKCVLCDEERAASLRLGGANSRPHTRTAALGVEEIRVVRSSAPAEAALEAGERGLGGDSRDRRGVRRVHRAKNVGEKLDESRVSEIMNNVERERASCKGG